MTVQDLMSEVRHLSLEERLQLLEFLAHNCGKNGLLGEAHDRQLPGCEVFSNPRDRRQQTQS